MGSRGRGGACRVRRHAPDAFLCRVLARRSRGLRHRSESAGHPLFHGLRRRLAAKFGYTVTTADGAPLTADGPVEAGVVALDRGLRCLQSVAVSEADTAPAIAPLVEGIRRLATWQATAHSINHAPVLVAERVFEPSFCRALIDYYNGRGGEDSGFMRQEGEYTVGKIDHSFKRRRDCQIEDTRLREAAMTRVYRRLAPLIRRSFQFDPTRIERHIVARYDSTEGGFFKAHRDNTTKGTAHRRFVVTINLNAQEYEGGDLRVPEFGQQAYRAPTGGAVVFSCSLLHEALPVTKGTRYAYLPFLYGDTDAELRERNKAFLDKASGGQVDVQAQLAGQAAES
ncbi:MAG: 2OG-Fe(II) oxygenase [Alphaproteobacteria bacterium]|nr:2OG-Fe(II) oxygenase [Alphaproteobacteria bacterium]